MKLTKYELDALSEKIADVKEQKHKDLLEELKLNQEFLDFSKNPESEELTILLECLKEYKFVKNLEAKYSKDIEYQYNELVSKYKDYVDLSSNYYREHKIENKIEKLKEEAVSKKFNFPIFNRVQLINTLKADIVMSDLKTPKEFYNESIK